MAVLAEYGSEKKTLACPTVLQSPHPCPYSGHQSREGLSPQVGLKKLAGEIWRKDRPVRNVPMSTPAFSSTSREPEPCLESDMLDK